MRTTDKVIKDVCNDIAEKFRPLRIILFGSYAYGRPKPDSDVDLLVIANFRGNPHRYSITIRRHINRNGVRFPMDILVRTPKTVAARIAREDWFLREIIEKGKILYEAPYARMARQG